MNALFAIPTTDVTQPNPSESVYQLGASVTAVRQAPGFFVIENRWSAHLVSAATVGGVQYVILLGHGPRGGFVWLKANGYMVWTLKEVHLLAGAVGTALRKAWPHWLVDGTLTTDEGDVVVSDYPWTFSGEPQTGTDGAMNVTTIIRPRIGVTTLGYPEDHDGDGMVGS